MSEFARWVERERKLVIQCLLVLTVVGIIQCVAGVTTIISPDLRASLHVGIEPGSTPVWVHLTVTFVMLVGAVGLFGRDAGLSCLFSLIGALYALEPLGVVSVIGLRLDLFIVPVLFVVALYEPSPMRNCFGRSVAVAGLSLSLTTAIPTLFGQFKLPGVTAWGNRAFELSGVVFAPCAVVALFIIAARNTSFFSSRPFFLFLGFFPVALYNTVALFVGSWREWASNPTIMSSLVLTVCIAPVGSLISEFVHRRWKEIDYV